MRDTVGALDALGKDGARIRAFLASLDTYTCEDLRRICREEGCTGFSRKKKTGLMDLIYKAVGRKKGLARKENAAIEILAGMAVDEKDGPVDGGGLIVDVAPPFKLGIHVFKGDDMAASIARAKLACPLNAVQIFTHGPRSTAEVKHDYPRVTEQTADLSLYVHSSYPTNPWSGRDDAFVHTIDQFVAAQMLGAKGVVLHIPLMEPLPVVLVVKALSAALLALGIDDVKVILEMKAVKQHATRSYESPAKINRLVDLLVSEGLTRANVGICIDTAHIYAGKAKIRTYAEGVAYCAALARPEWVCLLHLNGNVYDAKKRAGDKHAVPLDHEDKVWEGCDYRDSGCRAFIEWAQRNDIDIILEVKDHHTFEQVNAFVDKVVT